MKTSKYLNNRIIRKRTIETLLNKKFNNIFYFLQFIHDKAQRSIKHPYQHHYYIFLNQPL